MVCVVKHIYIRIKECTLHTENIYNNADVHTVNV